MAHTKVSMVCKFYGKCPLDKDGKPLTRDQWSKRRPHSWEVRWYGSDGTRYSKSFKDRKEASEHVKELQTKVDRNKADRPRQLSLAEFTKEHGRLMDGQVAHSTLKGQMRVLEQFGDHVGKHIALCKIKPQDAEAFVSARLKEGLSVETVNKDIRTLKGIFNRAIETRNYLPEGTNPFAKIKKRKTANKPLRYVAPEDLQKVFAVLVSRLAKDLAKEKPAQIKELLRYRLVWRKSLLALAYTSAGRRDELLNLTWKDVDFEQLTVTFQPKKNTDKLLAWEPKDHESRIIPVPAETIQLLADLQAISEESGPYVFLESRRLKLILDRRKKGTWEPDKDLVNNLLTRIQSICKHAKVDYFTLHDLRRSCITNWSQKLPIQTVKRLAGHSSIETTQKYYLAIREQDLVTARQLQSAIMSSLTNF